MIPITEEMSDEDELKILITSDGFQPPTSSDSKTESVSKLLAYILWLKIGEDHPVPIAECRCRVCNDLNENLWDVGELNTRDRMDWRCKNCNTILVSAYRERPPTSNQIN